MFVCVWTQRTRTQRTVYILTSHKYTWWIALLQNISDNTQINSVFYLPECWQILNTFTDLFQCTWANLHIYSLSPWTNLQIHYLSLSEKTQTDSRPVLSKRTLSFSPSRSSGMPDRKTRIFTLPTISLRRTLPFALTCTYICINFKNSNNKTASNVVAYNYSHQEK